MEKKFYFHGFLENSLPLFASLHGGGGNSSRFTSPHFCELGTAAFRQDCQHSNSTSFPRSPCVSLQRVQDYPKSRLGNRILLSLVALVMPYLPLLRTASAVLSKGTAAAAFTGLSVWSVCILSTCVELSSSSIRCRANVG